MIDLLRVSQLRGWAQALRRLYLPPETFRRDDSIIRHLVSSPSFARGLCLANDGDDTRWPMIESSLLKVSVPIKVVPCNQFAIGCF